MLTNPESYFKNILVFSSHWNISYVFIKLPAASGQLKILKGPNGKHIWNSSPIIINTKAITPFIKAKGTFIIKESI